MVLLDLAELAIVLFVLWRLFVFGKKFWKTAPAKDKVEELSYEATVLADVAKEAEELNVEELKANRKKLNNLDKLKKG